MKAAILYLPVIHAGHLEFCQRQTPDALFVLGKSLISKFPFLERDIRALSPENAVLEVKALALAPVVKILEKEDLHDLEEYDFLVLSEDEVSRELAEKYIKNKNTEWDTTFLRWNKMNAVTKMPVRADNEISSNELDKQMMALADVEAQKSSDWWRRVGAVILKDGKIIYSGHNKHAVTENTAYIEGEPRSNFDAGKAIADLVIFQHGEAKIISDAARDGVSLAGATLYVTTIPCPTCAMLVANAGIKRVYYKDGYSLLDAERILKNAGVELIQVLDK
ncbi:MAG: deaminase [bacterium]|nr:deaminase [bacterium]